MTPTLAATCLLIAATVLAWPASPSRARQRRLGFRPATWTGRLASLTTTAVRRGSALVAQRVLPVRVMAGVAAVCGVAGGLLGGPVAGLVLATYGCLGLAALNRRIAARSAAAARRRALDAIAAMAAELRAGAAISAADPAVSAVPELSRLVRAATRLAEVTGAPLADLLDRIEADGRASDRARAVATAARAGARATAGLLAALPAAGIGLGYLIGVDALRVLLNTPFGAGCAVAALALQLGGLAWSARLARLPDDAGGRDRPVVAVRDREGPEDGALTRVADRPVSWWGGRSKRSTEVFAEVSE